ncbi:MAG: energy transducer TonB [Gemmatimonadota bacterium]|nr:energy transducer TonB [Gemmatimonadota bacterium]
MRPPRPTLRAPAHPAALSALLSAVLSAACVDTVNPGSAGLRLGLDEGLFRPPAPLGASDVFEYPPAAWREGASGTTVLRILISTAGTVDSVQVLSSSGHRALDSAAVVNARRLRLRPAAHGGEAIPVWGRLPVIYPLPGEASSDVRPNP